MYLNIFLAFPGNSFQYTEMYIMSVVVKRCLHLSSTVLAKYLTVWNNHFNCKKKVSPQAIIWYRLEKYGNILFQKKLDKNWF